MTYNSQANNLTVARGQKSLKISGLGVDCVDIKRFRLFKSRQAAFFQKVFTRKELDYCFSFADPAPHLAGNFAAKEAAVKAKGGQEVSILDIEIIRDRHGRPRVFRKNKADKKMLVSISHTQNLAIALALWLN